VLTLIVAVTKHTRALYIAEPLPRASVVGERWPVAEVRRPAALRPPVADHRPLTTGH
jgi:hypothetical protein